MSREISYSMQRGMVEYFMVELKLPKGEVWAVIKEACFKCVDKLDNNNKSKSWCYAQIPNSDTTLRVDVKRRRAHGYNRTTQTYDDIEKQFYYADVKFGNIDDWDSFSDVQVEEYIIETILLGDE